MKACIFVFCLAHFFCACASLNKNSLAKQATSPQPLQTSKISSAEEERQKVLEHYREMRARSWDSYVNKEKKIPDGPIEIVPKKEAPSPTEIELTATPEPLPTASEEKPDSEVEIMADQKMRFHCSAQLTTSEAEKFNRCLTQAQEIWNDCKKEALSARKALTCLKHGL